MNDCPLFTNTAKSNITRGSVILLDDASPDAVKMIAACASGTTVSSDNDESMKINMQSNTVLQSTHTSEANIVVSCDNRLAETSENALIGAYISKFAATTNDGPANMRKSQVKHSNALKAATSLLKMAASQSDLTLATRAPGLPTPAALHSHPVLPFLTDDMFVIECPSFILPYVYEKPSIIRFDRFVAAFGKQLASEETSTEPEGWINKVDSDLPKNVFLEVLKTANADMLGGQLQNRPDSFFENPLGMFLMGIGMDLVQDYLRKDILLMQLQLTSKINKKRCDMKELVSTLKKDSSMDRKRLLRECRMCGFATESFLVMSHHLEVPHMAGRAFKCNYCEYDCRAAYVILTHVSEAHGVIGRLEPARLTFQCELCPVGFKTKAKLLQHAALCSAKFAPETNLCPPLDWDTPAKLPKKICKQAPLKQTKLSSKTVFQGQPKKAKIGGDYTLCEICCGHVRDVRTLGEHMERAHGVKIHPRLLAGRPPMNCSYCARRFFTERGLEGHLLGAHECVTRALAEAAARGTDAGRCPFCGQTFSFKLVQHVETHHMITLKPIQLSYRCAVCSESFSRHDSFLQHAYTHRTPQRPEAGKSGAAVRSYSRSSIAKKLKMNNTTLTVVNRKQDNAAATSTLATNVLKK